MRRLVILFSIIYPLAVFAVFPKWTVDDGYIAFRYAANFLSDGVLTWNVGEPPIEGYSDFAWLLLLAAVAKAGMPFVEASHFLGILSFFAGLGFLYLLAKKLRLGGLLAAILLCAYSLTPQFYTHALSGLETMLFVGAVIGCLYAALAAAEGGERPWLRETALCASLLFVSLVRPEGVALSAASFAGVWIYLFRRDRRRALRFFWRAIACYAVPAALYFIWRFRLYGFLLPNPYYVKTLGEASLSNVPDLARFLRRSVFALFFAAAVPFLAESDAIWGKIRRRQFWSDMPLAPLALGISGLFAAAIMFEIVRSHLIMNYAHRFYMPLLPIVWIALAVCAAPSLRALVSVRSAYPVRHRTATIVMLVLLAYQGLFHAAKLRDEMTFAADEKTMLEAEHIAAGAFLREIVPPNEWLAVYMDAGAIPYFSGLKTVDFGAINDTALAHGTLTPKERIDYFFSRAPGAVVFTSEAGDRVLYGDEVAAILADSRFGNYTLVKIFRSPFVPERPYHEFVYLRNDIISPRPEML